jgi:hypothetical protein
VITNEENLNDANSSELLSRLTLPAPVFSLPSELRPTLGKGREGRKCVLTFTFVCFTLHIAHAIVLAVTLGGVWTMDCFLAKHDCKNISISKTPDIGRCRHTVPRIFKDPSTESISQGRYNQPLAESHILGAGT